jgi:probable rRNA maturation factor
MVHPVVHLHQRQRKERVSMRYLREQWTQAVPLCLQALKFAEAPLAQLAEIEASIVSDKAIAKVHAEFLDDPTPTDVITFQYGEIIISADTAALAGPLHGNTVEEELLLYLIHGTLHLAGWEDEDPQEHDEMHAIQNRIFAQVK